MLVARAGEVHLTWFQLPRSSGAEGPSAVRSLMGDPDNDETDDRGCGHTGVRASGAPQLRKSRTRMLSLDSPSVLFPPPRLP